MLAATTYHYRVVARNGSGTSQGDDGEFTTFHIADALFPSLDFCQRWLRTLYRLRLIARFRPQRADGFVDGGLLFPHRHPVSPSPVNDETWLRFDLLLGNSGPVCNYSCAHLSLYVSTVG